MNPLGETRLRRIALKFLAWILITASIFLPWHRLYGYIWLFLIDLGILFPLVVFSSITGFLSLILPHYGARFEKADVILSLASGFTTLAPIIYFRGMIFPLPEGKGGLFFPPPTFVPYLVLLGALMMLLSSALTRLGYLVGVLRCKAIFFKFLAGVLVAVSIFLPWVWVTRSTPLQYFHRYWIYLIGATLEGNPEAAHLFETELWRELAWWRPLSLLFMTVSSVSGLFSFLTSYYKGARFKKTKSLSLVSGFMALVALCPCFYFLRHLGSQPPGSYGGVISYGIILTFFGALIWFINYASSTRQ